VPSVRWARSMPRRPAFPFAHEFPAQRVVAVVKQIRERLTVVSLSERGYVSALESALPDIIGNTACDALISLPPALLRTDGKHKPGRAAAL